MDKSKILQGREAREHYRSAHSELHSKPWTRDVPGKHKPLSDKLETELKEIGFESLGEFELASRELDSIEYTDYLVAKRPAEVNAVHLIDASELDLYSSAALQEVLFRLRQESRIPDTIWLHCLQNVAMQGVRVPDSKRGTRRASRCKELGLQYCRIIMPMGGGIHTVGDFAAVLFTRGTFTNVTEARECWASVILNTLLALGITGVLANPHSAQFAKDRKEVGGHVWGGLDGTYMIGAGIWVNLNWELLERLLGRPPARVEIRTVLQKETTMSQVKDVFLESCRKVSGVRVQERQLTGEEHLLISQLVGKYKDDAWNDRGETSTLPHLVR